MLPRQLILIGGLCALIPFQSVFSKEDAYVEGEVLITFKPAIEAEGAKTSLGRHSMQFAEHFDAISRQRGRAAGLVRNKARTTAQLIAELSADRDVEAVEPNYIRHVSTVTPPNDPNFSKLWALSNSGQSENAVAGTSGADTKFLAAWKLAKPDPNEVVIGVLDTGVDITHQDLAGNIWVNPLETAGNGVDDDGDGLVDDVNGYDFTGGTGVITDSGFHGTHVAGTIAAVGRNGLGVIGVDYKAKILPLKISSDGDSITSSAEIAAINYAVKLKQRGVNIVALNASFGGGSSTTNEKNAISALNTAGIILCAAAGNGDANGVGINNDATPSYPANYALPNIISVAASDQTDTLASFSNYGATTVDLSAPGVNIYSTVPLTEISVPASLTIGSTTYAAQQPEFSGGTTTTGITKSIYDCGSGNTSEFPTTVKGNIALIKRGTLTFAQKTTNAMKAGAVAAIIYDNVAPDPTDTGVWTLGTNAAWIPVLQVTQTAGAAIQAGLPATGTVISYRDPSLAYAFLDGTSMATPHVTGAVGFAAMNYPSDTVAQRIARILNHVTPVASQAGKTVTGGRLNLLGIVDTDGDGMPDWWETAHFGSLAQTAAGDFDSDGESNLDEFLDATDPADASVHLAFSGFEASTSAETGDHFVLSFPTVVDRTYTVQWSDTLAADSWTSVGAAVAGTGATVQVIDPADRSTVPKRFYRLHAE